MAAKHSPKKDTPMGMTYGVDQNSSSRRAFFACLGLLLSASSVLSCNKKSDAATTAPAATGSAAAAAPAPQKQFTAGYIFVGSKGDYGYNQAHAEGAKALTSMGVKVRE